jgi:excisionase family DNA binding protein
MPINSAFASPGRRGRGEGEPAPHPVPPATVSEDPWLLDSREVARLLGISRNKTFQLMASRELPVVRIGRCVRVSRVELQQWLLEQAAPVEPVEPTSWLRQTPTKLGLGKR